MSKDFESILKTEYRIVDLAKSGDARWENIFENDLPFARALIAEAEIEFKQAPVPWLLGPLFGGLYRLFGSYQEDLDTWAKKMKRSFALFTAISCGYEIDHAQHMLFGFQRKKITRTAPGCTNAIVWRNETSDFFHLRTLDWDFKTLGPATRVIKFIRGQREFVTVGFAGAVGVLSGMVRGAYSVAIDWAPPSEWVDFHYSPSFLLRHVLENCDTFDDAVQILSETPLATSVFYTVCGTTKPQACVIERNRRACAVRWVENGLLVQTNHYAPARTNQRTNPVTNDDPRNKYLQSYIDLGDKVAGTTFSRYDQMSTAMSSLGSKEASIHDSIFKSIDTEPVSCQETCHRVIFEPKSGNMSVQRRTVPQGSTSLLTPLPAQ